MTLDQRGCLAILARCPGWGSAREVEALKAALDERETIAKIIKTNGLTARQMRAQIHRALNAIPEPTPKEETK